MKELIFADKDNCKSIAHQLRFSWVKNILTQTGMNLDNCFCDSDDPNDQTIEHNKKLKKALSDNKITIIDNIDDSLFIYIQDQLIAQWQTPRYDKREDFTQLDRNKRFYVGIHLEYESVFDVEIEQTE